MTQPDSLNLVAEFHRTFKHPILPEPTIPAEDRCKLRVALLAEELKELRESELWQAGAAVRKLRPEKQTVEASMIN